MAAGASSERWRQIEDVFFTVLEAPTQMRDSILQDLCGGDDELRTEVLGLLAHDKTVGTLGEVITNAVELADRSPDLGLELGPYKIVEEIGQGGMGSVYKAVRTDDNYQQAVAIKLVRPGMANPFILSRIRVERRILGTLNHPNIARILDAGAAPDGRPYFVMEYIDGLPISIYAERNELTLEKRVLLFRQVCAAVQHAHQKLIIHRDIKPSNILVTKDGVPKLLDFGIAKLLTEVETTQALTAVRVATPQYASPEQIEGRELTTATDIYSLGTLLFELLSSQKPFASSTTNMLELERLVREADPPKPSSVATDLKIRRALAGDLDNIILRAMRKEPDRRYNSAEQFAQDLAMWELGLPVLAAKGTYRYYFQKWFRRNRTSAIAGAMVAATLVGAVITTSYQARRAERLFGEVRQLANTFLFDFYDEIETIPGATGARAKVVRTAHEYLARLSTQVGNDPALTRELAHAYMRLADVEGRALASNLGNTKGAVENYSRAIAMLEGLKSNDRQTQRALAEAYFRLGSMGKYAGGVGQEYANYGKALAIMESLRKQHPEDRELMRFHANLLRVTGLVLVQMTRNEEALAHMRAATGILENLMAESGDHDLLREFAVCQTVAAEVYMRRGKLREALEVQLRKLRIQEQLAARNPNNLEDQRNLMFAHSYVANVLGSRTRASLNEFDRALEHYRKMMEIAEKLAAADPKDSRSRFDLAVASAYYANVWEIDRRNPEALAIFDRSRRLLEQLMAEDPANLRVREMLAFALIRSALWQAELNRYEQAVASARRSVALQEGILKSDAKRFDLYRSASNNYGSMAKVLAKSGKCGEIDQAINNGLKVSQRQAEQFGTEDNRTRALPGRIYSDAGDAWLSCATGARPDLAKVAFGKAIETLSQVKELDPLEAAILRHANSELARLH